MPHILVASRDKHGKGIGVKGKEERWRHRETRGGEKREEEEEGKEEEEERESLKIPGERRIHTVASVAC